MRPLTLSALGGTRNFLFLQTSTFLPHCCRGKSQTVAPIDQQDLFRYPRFDLLYLILDNVDADADRRLAQHLVSLYMDDQLETAGIDVLVCNESDDIKFTWKSSHGLLLS